MPAANRSILGEEIIASLKRHRQWRERRWLKQRQRRHATKRLRSHSGWSNARARSNGTRLPADVRELARQCVLDWIGVALAGSSDPLPRLLIDEALADGGKPLATVVGHSRSGRTAAGGAHQRRRFARARLRRREPEHERPPERRDPAGTARARGSRGARTGPSSSRLSSPATKWPAASACSSRPGTTRAAITPLAPRARSAAATACAHLLKLDRRADGARGRHRRNAGRRTQIDVRNAVQAFSRRAGIAQWLACGPARGVGHDVPYRRARMPPGLRVDAQPRLQPAGRARRPRQVLRAREPLQIPRVVLRHARRHRVRAPVARSERARAAKHRARHGACGRGREDAMCNIAAPTTGLEAKFSLRFMTAAALARRRYGGLHAIRRRERARRGTVRIARQGHGRVRERPTQDAIGRHRRADRRPQAPRDTRCRNSIRPTTCSRASGCGRSSNGSRSRCSEPRAPARCCSRSKRSSRRASPI